MNVEIRSARMGQRDSTNGQDGNPGALRRDRTSDSREIPATFTHGRSGSNAPAVFSVSRSRVYSFETDALPSRWTRFENTPGWEDAAPDGQHAET